MNLSQRLTDSNLECYHTQKPMCFILVPFFTFRMNDVNRRYTVHDMYATALVVGKNAAAQEEHSHEQRQAWKPLL